MTLINTLVLLSLQMAARAGRAARAARATEATHSPAQRMMDKGLRDVPTSCFCPLSKMVMTDPVLLAASGHTYERAALAKHFAEQV
jgi:hypothetical protein